MSVAKRILSWLPWIITAPIQAAISLIVGEFAFMAGRGSIILMWLSMTLSIFLIGLLPISLSETIIPKRYFTRLGLVALGVLLPLIILSVIGISLNTDYSLINDEPGSLLDILAPIFGVICFYIPSPHISISYSSDKKWLRAAMLAILHTSPIPLLGLAQKIYIPSRSIELQKEYFYIYAVIWVIILSITILYKREVFE